MAHSSIHIIHLQTSLAEGSLRGCRAKYSKSVQRAAIERVVQELENGTLYLGDWKKGEIQITGIEQVVVTRYWLIVVYNVLFPPKSGDTPSQGTYQNIRWNIGLDAGAGALLLTNNNEVVLVRSFRHAKRAWTLELPRGTRRPNETLQACALREALEECGCNLSAKSEQVPLQIVDPDTGVMSVEPGLHAFTNVVVDESRVARDVSESWLGPVTIPIQNLYQMIQNGEVTDAFIQSALLQALIKGLVEPPSIRRSQ